MRHLAPLCLLLCAACAPGPTDGGLVLASDPCGEDETGELGECDFVPGKADDEAFPDGFPMSLRKRDADTPVPSFDQLVRAGAQEHALRRWNVLRIMGRGGPEDEAAARARFAGWSVTQRTGFALIVETLAREGWLEGVGPMINDPWADGFMFKKASAGTWTLEDLLAQRADRYTKNSITSGWFAYFTRWNHAEWSMAWMLNNVGSGSIHVGVYKDDPSVASLHLEIYNPLYTNGAPWSEAGWLPAIGSFNAVRAVLHKRWESHAYAPLSRRTANYYAILKARYGDVRF